MNEMQTGLLDVNGTRLSYVTQGRGPLLFLVGAPVGISGFASLASHLAQHRTVVTHDPRGIGLSAAGVDYAVTPAMLAEDIRALVDTLAHEPVEIFGTSGGAVTSLEFAARHPRKVKTIVAHEPPLFSLLPDAADVLMRADAAFALGGTDPDRGMQAFVDLTEIFQFTTELMPRPAPIKLPPSTPEEREKNRFMLSRMAPALVHHSPNVAGLPVDRIAIAAGQASKGQPARRASEALATLSGARFIEAPGNHLGFALAADRFADWILKVFQSQAAPSA